MRTIDHLAVEARHTGARRGSERRHHAPRLLALRLRRRKRGIDGGDLLRVNGELAGETVPAGALPVAPPPLPLTEVRVHAIDGLNAERRGGEQAGGARQLKRERERAAA